MQNNIIDIEVHRILLALVSGGIEADPINLFISHSQFAGGS